MKALVLILSFSVTFFCSTGDAQSVYPNILIHPDTATYQYELSVATNPSDRNTVLVASVARSADIDHIGWYYTTDGGNTWTGSDTLPTQSNLNTYMRDPCAGIDLAGYLYVNGIAGNGDVFVARSSNGGVSWNQTTVANTSGHERPHMTIDPNPASPYHNNIYVAYTDLNITGHPVRFSGSTNQGVSFSTPVSISGGVGGTGNVGVNLAVGPDGSLYATWPGYDSPPQINPLPFHLGFNKSTDGGSTWDTARAIGLISYNGSLAKPLSFFNCPSMAVDVSNGPRRGWIYIVYAEKSAADPDIFLVRSTDEGTSWSSAMKVNQDDSGNDQWQPWISVDPITGKLFVVYYDSRNFIYNDSAEVFISTSIDGGATFLDRSISEQPFLPRAVWDLGAMGHYYMGSYIGIAALEGIVWPVWTDTRPGVHQAYTSRWTLSGPIGTLSPSKVNFSPVECGTYTDTTIVLANYGSDTLKITGIVSSNPVFSARPTSGDIPPGQKIVDTIRFAPSESGSTTGTLSILSNGELSTDMIAVSGTGTTAVEMVTGHAPKNYELSQNYPNPFNPATTITYQLPVASDVRLSILNLLGCEVAVLVNAHKQAGTHQSTWDATPFASGVYFCRLQAGDFTETKKLVLVR